MISSLIRSLILTIIIEVPIAIILKIRDKEDIKIIFFANVLTNPIVVFSANLILLLNNNFIYYLAVIILEIMAIVVECVLYKKYLVFKEKSPLFITCISNIISFLLGVVINNFIF
ncbi:MAG: hypothetical protein IKL55_04765 [Clostridia bacterium]|nr:hypothetical protein [Clostridia bacterium]